ncbi:unnamed protein product, partial [Mesorhabditis spiculigera]
MQGGNLDIISATEALSAWEVDDAVIVLFTGSDQNNIDAAGRDYMRKEWTIGVAESWDTYETQIDYMRQIGRQAFQISVTSPYQLYARALHVGQCGIAFYFDGSKEGWPHFELQHRLMESSMATIFRENMYGFNLQGADMSRIARPLTFPLDDEWISEFRDSCTTPIA